MPVFRTDDDTKWGTGLGRRLTAGEVDENFWELLDSINNIIANPAQPIQIVGVTGSGNALTFHMSNGTDIGPIFLPVLQFHWRDEWTATTPYQQLDVFRVTGVGLYSVLQDHISGATFDENLIVTIDGDDFPVYLKLFGFAAVPYVLTSPAEGQILRYNATISKFENVAQKYILATNFNGIMGNNQDLLHHKLATGISFNANFADYLEYSSDAGAVVNATADTTVTIAIAPKATPNTFTDIGTVTIAAGTVTPTFATVGAAAKSGSKGDVLRIRGPATADVTLSGFYCTIVGKEQ